MEKGTNNTTNYVISYIGKERLSEINEYIENVLKEKSVTFTNKNEINDTLKNLIDDYILRLSKEEIERIKSYTFLDFRIINPILRGYWDYEKSGALTESMKSKANESADILRKSIMKVSALPFNMHTFRGVSIRAFYSYGITCLEDLIYMQDKFIYESGFTSTSMLEDTSFFAHNPEWGDKCNIEIDYLIPENSDDGIPLTSSVLCHSTSQNEFLINSSSLFKVVDVEIDKKQNIAKMKVVLLPEKIWNPLDYEMERKGKHLE